jgi:hypothetical protein
LLRSGTSADDLSGRLDVLFQGIQGERNAASTESDPAPGINLLLRKFLP